jgi:hypothetical protein
MYDNKYLGVNVSTIQANKNHKSIQANKEIYNKNGLT